MGIARQYLIERMGQKFLIGENSRKEPLTFLCWDENNKYSNSAIE